MAHLEISSKIARYLYLSTGEKMLELKLAPCGGASSVKCLAVSC